MSTAALLPAVNRLLESAALHRKVTALARPQRRMRRSLEGAFRAQGRAFLIAMWRERDRFAEADRSGDWWAALLLAAFGMTAAQFAAALRAGALPALLAGAASAADDLGADAFSGDDPQAVAYLATLADVQAGLEQTTRDRLAAVFAAAVADSWSWARTRAAVDALYETFATDRAALIADTEANGAFEAGRVAVARGYADGGYAVEKAWILSPDHPHGDECDDNVDDGWIPLDGDFSGGVSEPPQHPSCGCSTDIRVADATDEAA